MNVIVSFLVVLNLLVHKYMGEKMTNWVTSPQEYGLEIKPSKVVRGQGLWKLVVEGNTDYLKRNDGEEVELDEMIAQALVNAIEVDPDSWYDDLKQLLVTGLPPEGLNPKQKRSLKMKLEPYQLI